MSYEQAQRALVAAETALRAQDGVTARQHFREAARLQEAYVQQLPQER